jgi:hypothetical protein
MPNDWNLRRLVMRYLCQEVNARGCGTRQSELRGPVSIVCETLSTKLSDYVHMYEGLIQNMFPGLKRNWRAV